jgi:hypothetical protein
LTAFASEAELLQFMRDVARTHKGPREGAMLAYSGLPLAMSQPSGIAEAALSIDESITNVQHAGVDEGGIVKVRGDHLVVLRRGRLFTVRIGDDSLRPVSAADAFGPDVDPRDAWYDEMLVSDDTVVVVGYSYGRGGTELGLFHLDQDGGLRHRATYHLRSNDYYSSRNYASRLLGRKLVFYTPLYLWPDEQAPLRGLPALRRWRRGAKESDFRPIYHARTIYRPLAEGSTLALHTVTVCDLAAADLTCTATGVMGPPERVFYVSPRAVYVWMTDSWSRKDQGASSSLLYRLPLDGDEPSALGVRGGPVDQFSFLEEDGHLNVLVRADAGGDGMWRAEVTEGDVALLRLPLGSFTPDVEEVPAWRYRSVPRPDGYVLQNRFVGGHVLYGSGNGWGYPQDRTSDLLFAYRYADGAEPVALRLGHGVDRIEPLGADALVVGTAGAQLRFASIDLGGHPAVAGRYTRANASQGELRSHGFFYRAEAERRGLLGLPVRGAGRPGYEHLFRDSASVLFLRVDELRLRPMGELTPRTDAAAPDACRASCVDWYGNARPLFLQGRVFALLGYEIVEGRLLGPRLEERRRIDFAPQAVSVRR